MFTLRILYTCAIYYTFPNQNVKHCVSLKLGLKAGCKIDHYNGRVPNPCSGLKHDLKNKWYAIQEINYIFR